ncbi:hypothetical protein BDV96DRAFT_642109 [Lophiotrema nucula]|uniref:Ubiquitin 3 binding protein But2 C-terminal domain-containing protein n=1 Tax=Lophiotrema nucula TaxID=690887 RepID=A0A6A5ZM70_9PLEO|nr:hypothetical protein BDV96DRAFT_642109 [Lophiotrema nucula]
MIRSVPSLLHAFVLLPFASGLPHISARQDDGPGLHTLTAYAPENNIYNGLKVEYKSSLNVFQEKTSSICPIAPAECPNGTDTVFLGVFNPSSEVPGGQIFYVEFEGLTRITVQHTHSFPPGAYPYNYPWTWHAFDSIPSPAACPTDDELYNCGVPTGYFTFKAPNGPESYEGGLKACPNENDASVISVYGVTLAFNRTGCVDLEGLATHTYTGVNPPVWAY